jgi:hypothetical protein
MSNKITKRFVWTDDSEYGSGFKPDWIPQADPTQGFGAAHDVLEHIIDTRGGFEGEMMAFGAMHYVRQYYPWRTGMVYDNQHYDIANFLRNVESEMQTCVEAPISKDDWHEDYTFSSDEMRVWVRRAIMMYIKEAQYGDESRASVLRVLPVGISDSIVGWISAGYQAAVEFYTSRQISKHDAVDMFVEVQRLFDQHTKGGEAGDYLDIHVDWESQEVTATKGNTYEDEELAFSEEEEEETA